MKYEKQGLETVGEMCGNKGSEDNGPGGNRRDWRRCYALGGKCAGGNIDSGSGRRFLVTDIGERPAGNAGVGRRTSERAAMMSLILMEVYDGI